VIPVIQNGVEEVRRICMDLRPSILDDLGILATISWFSREFQVIYSDIRIEQEIDLEEGDVPEALKIVIYRVLQEALNNIAKHSKATLVRLCLTKSGDAIELRVDDNGLGFNLADELAKDIPRRGLGLASMKERTETSGGSFSVTSVPGTGSSLRASWLLSSIS
jgi:signal transduction histidine kinase